MSQITWNKLLVKLHLTVYFFLAYILNNKSNIVKNS